MPLTFPKCCATDQCFRVSTSLGRIRGHYDKNVANEEIIKFTGIPYAEIPEGDLRFKSPRPVRSYKNGEHNAQDEGYAASSFDPFNRKDEGREDCLYLSVYIKKPPEGTGKSPYRPVLVWLHGGCFTWGSNAQDNYGPKFLLTEDIVLVTINYRLGLLGFASFKDPTLEIPGNAGMKDQVLALKWVKDHIEAFGGNSINITLFGQDAGAASACLLMLSPMTKGLFNRVIVQSGCPINPWVLSKTGCADLAKELELEGASDSRIFEELNKRNHYGVVRIQNNMLRRNVSKPNIHKAVGVVVEENSKDPFLDKDPMEILLSGEYHPVPLMIGYTNNEGMYVQMEETMTTEILEKYIPWFLGYTTGSPGSRIVARKLAAFYGDVSKEKLMSEEKHEKLVTDSHLLSGLYLYIILYAPASPIFFYRMKLDTSLNYFKIRKKIEKKGAAHMDDIGYLFNTKVTPESFNASHPDYNYMKRFVRLWTNFATHGVPTPHEARDEPLLDCVWRLVQRPDFNFLDIGEKLVLDKDPNFKRMKFWFKLYAESPAGQEAEEKYKVLSSRQELLRKMGVELGEGSSLKEEEAGPSFKKEEAGPSLKKEEAGPSFKKGLSLSSD